MVDKGRILMADDERVFLEATADLLRDEGYHCDAVADGPSVVKAVSENHYDVLIADIKMPGNADLELIHEVKQLDEGLPVILVTGYPSMKSAIKSVKLPVSAYVVKPIDLDELLREVDVAVERTRMYRSVCKTQERLLRWHQELEETRKIMSGEPSSALAVPVDTYVAITLSHVVGGLADLRNVTSAIARTSEQKDVCALMDCPRTRTLVHWLRETISILEKTKRSFKSKDLSELRKRLEELLKEEEALDRPGPGDSGGPGSPPVAAPAGDEASGAGLSVGSMRKDKKS